MSSCTLKMAAIRYRDKDDPQVFVAFVKTIEIMNEMLTIIRNKVITPIQYYFACSGPFA